MKKNIFNLIGLIFILTKFSGCHKEAEITRLRVIEFPGALISSVNSVVLTAENDSIIVVSFDWQAVSYGIEAPVTYSLQFTIPSDTIGTTPWANARELPVGDDLLTKDLMGYELNQLAVNELGLEPGVDAIIAVRVKSFVNRPAYSKAIALGVNPHRVQEPPKFPSLWVPGDYQGWNPAAAPTIVSVKDDGLYMGYVYFAAGGTFEFKYTAQPSWEPLAYGDGGAGSLIETNYAGVNFLKVPSEGYYQLSANLSTMRWTATRTTWSVIGDATPGGWTTDTPMRYDVLTNVWTVTLNMITAGSFKFRANNSWALNFGIDAEGNLVYADNPLLPYNPNQSNLTVPADGNYTITLNLSRAGQYTFTLRRN